MEIMTEKDYAKFLTKLKEMSDGQTFVDFQKRIVKTNKTVFGVKAVDLRKFANEIYHEKHDGLFLFGKNDVFEEVLVKGLVIAKFKDADEAIEKLNELSESFDSWAETDMICSKFCFFKNNEEKLFEFFSMLAKREEEFVCRFGIVCLMKYFLDDSHGDKVFNILDGVICGKYYVDMAISWLICECLVKKPQNAVENMQNIIKNRHFNCFIINKAIQKATESFRIDKETKNKLRELKIR